jgi:hypothetical protein
MRFFLFFKNLHFKLIDISLNFELIFNATLRGILTRKARRLLRANGRENSFANGRENYFMIKNVSKAIVPKTFWVFGTNISDYHPPSPEPGFTLLGLRRSRGYGVIIII